MNPIDPEPFAGPIAPDRPTVMQSTWAGARKGARRASYIAVPIGLPGIVAFLAGIAFSLGTQRGLLFLSIPVYMVNFALACLVCGMIIGASLGFVVGLIRRTRPGSRIAAGWEAANRPIRILSRRPIKRRAVDDDGLPPPRRRRVWPWLVAVPTLVLLAASFATGVYAGKAVSRRLEEAIAAADEDDPYWRLEDVMDDREPVPDEENGALVVAEVASLMPSDWPSLPSPPPPPTPGHLDANAAFDRMTDAAINTRLDDATVATLREELDDHPEAVELARTVADYERGRHELVLTLNPLDILLPETQGARAPARLVAADAAIRAHDGDLDGAIDSCRAILGIGRSIGDEPTAISQLVRTSIGGVAMQASRRVLGQGEPSDEALALLQDLLLDEMDHPLLLHGMRGQRGIQVDLFAKLATGEIQIPDLSGGSSPQDSQKPRPRVIPMGTLWFEYQLAVELEWMNEAVNIARHPAPERARLADAWEAEIDRVHRSRFGMYTTMLPLLLTPAVDASFSAQTRYQCELGATALSIATERHRRRTGSWPESIAAIDPEILPEPPPDPYTGQPYLLEHRDGRMIIHSVGPNLRDEKGTYDLKRWRSGMSDDVGSIVWDVSSRGRPAEPDEEE